jgi:uncharacterized membrane protein
MKKLNRVFWISFAVYSAFTFIGTLVIERNQNDLGFLINMKGYIPLMKYFTLVGLVFFAIAFIYWWRGRMRFTKAADQFETEKKELKATIFDLQEKREASNSKPEEATPPEPEE